MSAKGHHSKKQISARDKRRRHRKNVVRLEKVVIAAIILVVVGCASLLVWNLLPSVKVSRQIKTADELIQSEAYEEAIATYQEAINTDETSVKAYRAMAGAYLTIADATSAEKVLYQGWETTQDAGLLDYYCTVLLNEAVEEINEQRATFETMSKCVAALEKDPTKEEAYSLLGVCYNRLLQTQDAENVMTRFCPEKEDQVGGFEQYIDAMNRLLILYNSMDDSAEESLDAGTDSSADVANGVKENLKQQILTLAVIDLDETVFETSNLEAYIDMLKKVEAVEANEAVNQIRTVMEKASWALNVFAPAFTIWESEDFTPIKEFMNSDEYVAIRDDFLNGTMEYWSGQTYIPVSREKVKLLKDENGTYSFAFPSFEENPQTAGVISIWATQQADAGVQRLAIAYEPASKTDAYLPHTSYDVTYLYSNVTINGQYVPQMNYRFETKVETADGIETDLIGDWGGEHQWETVY